MCMRCTNDCPSSSSPCDVVNEPMVSGKGGTKCHRKILRDNIKGITKPAILRPARGGGVKSTSDL